MPRGDLAPSTNWAGVTTAAIEPLPASPVSRLQPRTAPQLLDAGFEVLKYRTGTIALLLAATYVPFHVGALILLRQSADHNVWQILGEQFVDVDSNRVLSTSDLLWTASGIACGLVGEMVFGVALATLVRRWMEGVDAGAREIVGHTARRLPLILAAWLMAFVLKAVGLALCGVGLLLVVPQLSILAPVAAFEPGPPWTWLRRSRELTTRLSSAALGLTLLGPALSLSIAFGLWLGRTVDVFGFEQFAAVMATGATFLVVAARSSAAALFYLDIRVRTEGLDLAIRAPKALGDAL